MKFDVCFFLLESDFLHQKIDRICIASMNQQKKGTCKRYKFGAATIGFSQHKWVFWQGSATRGQLASREGYPDLEKQPTCGTDRLPKISRACMWQTHEILSKVILNRLAATKVVLSLYGLIMFMSPVFFIFTFQYRGPPEEPCYMGKSTKKKMDR